MITWNSKSTENEQICSLFIICRSTNEEMNSSSRFWSQTHFLYWSCQHENTTHTVHSRFFSSWIKLNILSISLFIYDTLTNITHTQRINSWIIQTIRLALWFASQSDAPLKQDAGREGKNLKYWIYLVDYQIAAMIVLNYLHWNGKLIHFFLFLSSSSQWRMSSRSLYGGDSIKNMENM